MYFSSIIKLIYLFTTFAYKATADVKFGVGMASAGNVTETATADVSVDAAASQEWVSKTVTLTPDTSADDTYVMPMLVYTSSANEVYIDDIAITFYSEDNVALENVDFGFDGSTFPKLNAFVREDEIAEDTNKDVEIWDGSVATKFAGGTGTESDPYQISNGKELALAITQSGSKTESGVTTYEAYYGKHFKLVSDIYLNDVSAVDWLNGSKNSGYTVNPWYNYNENFAGTIDGDGHTVYGLYHYTGGKISSSIDYAKYGKQGAGLIPLVNDNDTVIITNMGIDCSYVRHQYSAGAFIGSGATSTITNCFVGENVKVEGKDIGAFIGRNYAKKFTLQNCHSLATVYGNEQSYYGLAGQFYQTTATMKNCYNANGPLTSFDNGNYSTWFKFYNSYETEASGDATYDDAHNIKTNVYQITADNMQGLDVFTHESKMMFLALDTSGAATTTYTATETYPILTSFVKTEQGEEDSEPEDTASAVWNGEISCPVDSNGDGVYEINTAEELAYIIANHGGEGNKYILTNDIYLNDISKFNWVTGDILPGYVPNIWFNYEYNFEGSIDGNGYRILGLYYNNGTAAKKWAVYGSGFIPKVLHGDTVNISNLGIDYAYVNSDTGVSAFVGCAGSGNSATDTPANINITGCYVGANVGLVGYSTGAFQGAASGSLTYITDCYSLATLTGNATGLFAMTQHSSKTHISGCFNANGPISSSQPVASVTNSYQTVSGKGLTTVTSLANMQGVDVLTNAEKMPNLNAEAFTAVTQSFSDYDFYIYLPIGTNILGEYELTFYNDLFVGIDASSVCTKGVMGKGAYVKFNVQPKLTDITVPAELSKYVR